jgi:hypothetical protein
MLTGAKPTYYLRKVDFRRAEPFHLMQLTSITS